MTMEYREETVARLRKQLGREPTEEEIKAERDRRWRLQLNDMAITAMLFKDEELPVRTRGIGTPALEKIEMPRIEPSPRVEFDMDSSERWLKRMDRRKAEFLCTIEWSWSPANERMESLSFPKIRSGRIRAVKENQSIIQCDVCGRLPAWNLYRRSVQVAAPA